MRQHFENFENADSTFSVDFENRVISLSNIISIKDALLNAIALSSIIHHEHGRATYHLLKASNSLLTCAELLLKNDMSKSYLNEKLEHAATSLNDALTELDA